MNIETISKWVSEGATELEFFRNGEETPIICNICTYFGCDRSAYIIKHVSGMVCCVCVDEVNERVKELKSKKMEMFGMIKNISEEGLNNDCGNVLNNIILNIQNDETITDYKNYDNTITWTLAEDEEAKKIIEDKFGK